MNDVDEKLHTLIDKLPGINFLSSLLLLFWVIFSKNNMIL